MLVHGLICGFRVCCAWVLFAIQQLACCHFLRTFTTPRNRLTLSEYCYTFCTINMIIMHHLMHVRRLSYTITCLSANHCCSRCCTCREEPSPISSLRHAKLPRCFDTHSTAWGGGVPVTDPAPNAYFLPPSISVLILVRHALNISTPPPASLGPVSVPARYSREYCTHIYQ